MSNHIEKRRDQLLGKEFETLCGRCFIIDYRGAKDVTVMFYEPVYATKCRLSHLKDGNVKNPLIPSVYGRGYYGVGKYSTNNIEVYKMWNRMLERCYDEKYYATTPTYRDVEVCDEWLNFQNFAAWCYSQKFFNAKDDKGRTYHLDKDILVEGIKLYSPETCCFVPQEINKLMTKSDSSRGEYPIGVCFSKVRGKFEARVNRRCGQKHLGSYEALEEAFQAYKTAKEVYIKEVAERWKGKIDDKVYKALLEWKIEITD